VDIFDVAICFACVLFVPATCDSVTLLIFFCPRSNFDSYNVGFFIIEETVQSTVLCVCYSHFVMAK